MPTPTDMPKRFGPRRYAGAILSGGANAYRAQTETSVKNVDAQTDRDTQHDH